MTNTRTVFELLGAPRLLVDGRPLMVDTRKAVALGAYLAMEHHRPTRDELVALLWPELEAERGRGALRRTLSTLRTALGTADNGQQVLAATRDQVALERSMIWLDVNEAQRLAQVDHSHGRDRVCPECIRPLSEAARLYRGPFMHGFHLRDSAPFEDWQRAQAELIQRQRRELLDRLSLALASAGRFSESASVTRQRLADDPLDESGHRRLMQYLVWDGDRVGALRQYRECALLLEQELGVPPLTETRELYEEILEGVEPLPPAGRVEVAATPVRPRAAPPVRRSVGRTEELSAMSGASTHIFISGDEGIGKSDLLARFLAEQSGPVARCWPPPGTSDVAYLAIRDALIEAKDSGQGQPPPIAAEAVRLVPELGGHFGSPDDSVEGPGAAARFHTGVAAALEHLLTGGWLVIDDAQWLDAGSATVLAVLLSQPRRMRVLLSWRTGELAEPLRTLARKLETAGEGLWLRIEALSESEASELCELRAEPGTSATDKRVIVERSAGNPLFLLSYLAASGSARADLPADIEELIGSRLDRLSESAAQVLGAAAIIGPEFQLEDARWVSGRGSEEMVPALDELLGHRLVVETEAGVAFAHDAVRRAVSRRLSKARARLLHARAGERLRLAPAVRAGHLEAAGQYEQAALAHAEAGRAALAVHAYEAARSHLGSALELGHPDRPMLGRELGEACVHLGNYGAALAAYATLPETADIVHRVGEIYLRLGRLELAAASWERAASLQPEDALASRIIADRALAAHRLGRANEARQLISAARQLADGVTDSLAKARAAAIEAMIAGDRIDLLEAACALAVETGRADVMAAALNNLALAQRRGGLLAGSIASSEEALALLEPVGDRHRLAALHSNLADTLHLAGEETRAQDHLTQAALLFANVGLDPDAWEPEVWMLSEW